MPLYEYSCSRCGFHFDVLRGVAQRDGPAECPECRSSETSREWPTFARTGNSTDRPQLTADHDDDRASGAGVGFRMAGRDVTMTNCHSYGNRRGLVVESGGSMTVDGFTSRRDGIGIENRGKLHARRLDID